MTVSAHDRVVIEDVRPEIDGGVFPVKKSAGEALVVEADIFAEGVQCISAVLKIREEGERYWIELPMSYRGNVRWVATFTPTKCGCYAYTIEAWVDPIRTWHSGGREKAEAGGLSPREMAAGISLIEAAIQRAAQDDAALLAGWMDSLQAEFSASGGARIAEMDSAVSAAVTRCGPRHFATAYGHEVPLWVEPVLARFGAWYQVFPRSCSRISGRHGTFEDLSVELERIAAMGFDVVYLPPIHPIGVTDRKGKRNSVRANPDDPGSPWAVGGTAGGHKAVHPDLGTIEDFRCLVRRAETLGLKIALDMALQCSPDHPYVREHPDWFSMSADGELLRAEDFPNRYDDVCPFSFDTADWENLWLELKSIFELWVEQGVTVFRVDNPHTKPFPFWRWLVAEVKRQHPEVILLSEGLTRPKLQHFLAKLGFSLSYDYFPWRNTKSELTSYYSELARTPVRDYFRPILWPNTPQNLPRYLQGGGRPAFIARLVLAATLGASYGIYGPAYELCVDASEGPDSTEYKDSEQYELTHWNTDSPTSIAPTIARINRIRRENPALHYSHTISFHETDNDSVIAYSKATDDLSNVIIVIVNLDPRNPQSGWVSLALDRLGLSANAGYCVVDLLNDTQYEWQGDRNYFRLDPYNAQAHILRVVP